MHAEDKYKYGPRIEPSEDWRAGIKRLNWCVKNAGYILPKVNWYFHRWIHCKEAGDTHFRPIGGVSTFNESSTTIRCSIRNQKLFPSSLAVHEMAHAITGFIEDNTHPHEHSDLWGVILARLYRQYWDTEEGPPRPRYYPSKRPEDGS